jgi:hypothetical protein
MVGCHCFPFLPLASALRQRGYASVVTDETKVMFASYAEFKKRLKGTFGDIDKE